MLSSDSHVLVTGGSRGIGRAIATRFASLGASTTIVGRSPATLEAAYVTGDVASTRFWYTLARSLVPRRTLSAQANFDPTALTMLVNAAGLAQKALLMRQPVAAVESVVQTNLMSTVWACKAMAKPLAGSARRLARDSAPAAGCGRVSIVNVSSLLALQGGVGSAAYAASKAGVLALTRALAGEMGPLGVRVNAIVPGYVETDMTAAMQPATRKRVLGRIPLKRFGTVEEIADAAVFLSSNSYANNCIVNLDGGLSAVNDS